MAIVEIIRYRPSSSVTCGAFIVLFVLVACTIAAAVAIVTTTRREAITGCSSKLCRAFLSRPEKSLNTSVLDTELKFPFRWIVSWPNHERLMAVSVNAPFRDKEAEDIFRLLESRGVFMMGFTHYQEFPGKIPNPHEDAYHTSHPFDYVGRCSAWGTCFRDPAAQAGIGRDVPQIPLVESDFTDLKTIGAYETSKKGYDYIYVCLTDDWNKCDNGWQAYCRNWKFASKAIERFSAAGLKGLLVGRQICKDQLSAEVLENVELTTMLDYWEFLKKLAASRVVFVPNVHDASPRVAAEGMTLGTALLMNKDICGGWKYVHEDNGVLFDEHGARAVDDVVDHMKELVSKSKRGLINNQKYRTEFGRENSSRALGKFLVQQGVRWDGPDVAAFIKV